MIIKATVFCVNGSEATYYTTQARPAGLDEIVWFVGQLKHDGSSLRVEEWAAGARERNDITAEVMHALTNPPELIAKEIVPPSETKQ